jgi:hypothetical protein
MLAVASPLIASKNWDSGYDYGKKESREEAIIFCNQKPQKCKKEFNYYQLKKEVESKKEDNK